MFRMKNNQQSKGQRKGSKSGQCRRTERGRSDSMANWEGGKKKKEVDQVTKFIRNKGDKSL